jgi:outer membrane protein TolC
MESIRNGELQVERSAEVEARTRALVQSGRTEPFQADLATQNTLFALDRLSTLRETHRLTLDRFKVRIGLRTEDPVRIDPIQFDLPVPAVDMRESVATAMRFRLTLQTARDEVEDFGRKVDVARNNLLGDLDLFLSNSLPTDPTRARGRLGFDGRYDDFRAELVFSAPLDRVTEDLQLRQAQILLERARRNALLEADNTAVAVRQAVRAMERAQFSVVVQQKNVEAALNRQAAIDAAPDRATARDRTEAVDQLRQAQDQLAGANRDLQLAILRYLNASGQLRISPEGRLLPIPGMVAEASDADAGATKEETP